MGSVKSNALMIGGWGVGIWRLLDIFLDNGADCIACALLLIVIPFWPLVSRPALEHIIYAWRKKAHRETGRGKRTPGI